MSNWYKRAQTQLTLNNIIWAIDEILLTEVISEADISDAFNRNGVYQEYKKVAQVKISPYKSQVVHPIYKDIKNRLDKKVLNLFEQGIEYKNIANNLGLKEIKVKEILLKYFPSIPEAKQHVYKLHETDVLNLIKERHPDIDFKINTKKIAEILGFPFKVVKNVMNNNGISAQQLMLERKTLVEDTIVNFIDNIDTEKHNITQAYKLFVNTTGHKIRRRTFDFALSLRNIRMTQRDENLIVKAFKDFLWGFVNTQQTLGDLVRNNRIEDLADRFIKTYGKYFGFSDPPQQEELKKLLMTKIQLRERIKEYTDSNKFYNYYFNNNIILKIIPLIKEGLNPQQIASQLNLDSKKVEGIYQIYNLRNSPMIYDENHPSYFLKGEPNEQLV